MKSAAIIIVIAGAAGCGLALDHGYAGAQEEGFSDIIPPWMSETASEWINGDITDNDFWTALKTLLLEQEDRLAGKGAPSSQASIAAKAETADTPAEPARIWIEDRTRWWIEGRITDEHFLNAVLHLNNSGFLESMETQDPDSTHLGTSTGDAASLESLLLTEQEIDHITRVTKWRFVTTEHGFDRTEGVADSVRILMRDISRVYDPVFNKYRVATISMQITQLSEQSGMDNYWQRYTNLTSDAILKSAHMTGSISDDTKCFFSYSGDGAVTACTHKDMVMQVIIFDAYNEHYHYKNRDISIDETEPTTRIMDGIIRKISAMTGANEYDIPKLRNALQNSPVQPDSMQGREPPTGSQDVLNATSMNGTGPITTPEAGDSDDDAQRIIISDKSYNVTDPEKLTSEGIMELTCVRDDFGIVTVAGRYVNGGAPSSQIHVEISFTDWQQEVIGSTAISFSGMSEFESRRFLGHAEWNGNFAGCHGAVIAGG